jgi:hypothetical protein
MVNCVIFASVTEAALTGDRFSCIEARHASFLDAYQCTVALKAPEMVLRAAHTTLVHASSRGVATPVLKHVMVGLKRPEVAYT